MQAVSRETYGPAEDLVLSEVSIPEPTTDQVLVRVQRASVNTPDAYAMEGHPVFLRIQFGPAKPKQPILGTDIAGVVESVGPDVTKFSAGDRVFGGAQGGFAEYALAKEKNIALMPEGMGFEQAATIPTAGLTALQGLRDAARLQAGQTVLVNGASGGVGNFAVQIAKSMGAHVTGVCSTRNIPLVESLGADVVIDYTTTDFTQSKYDIVFDIIGNRSLSELGKTLTTDGKLIPVGAPKGGKILGPLVRFGTTVVRFGIYPKRAAFFVATFNTDDLTAVADLCAEGTVTPVIDTVYPLDKAGEAMRHFQGGHSRGKVLIDAQGDK